MKANSLWLLFSISVAVISCTSRYGRFPASDSDAKTHLIKVCKAESGAKWELYSFAGNYQDSPDEIHFFGRGKTNFEELNHKDDGFYQKRAGLQAMIALDTIECFGAEKFDSSVISDLKAELNNFAQTSCTDQRYLKSVRSIEASLSGSNSSVSEKNQSAILSDILKDLTAAEQGQSDCRKIIEKIGKELDSLFLKDSKDRPNTLPVLPGAN